ncbi:MAG: hypothetical protein AAGJ32_04940 [Pseudomonadota bacterium]
MKQFIMPILMAAALLAGCASTPDVPSVGDEIRTSGFGNLGEDWDKADKRVIAVQRAVHASNERIERGEKLIPQANKNLRRGEDQVERGQRELRDAERALTAAQQEKTRVETRFRAIATANEAATPSEE